MKNIFNNLKGNVMQKVISIEKRHKCDKYRMQDDLIMYTNTNIYLFVNIYKERGEL